jgi:hypothetical protein
MEAVMKIELKKLALYPRMSEETTAFAADLWINGAKVGSAKNDGRGGMTFVHWAVPQERRREIEAALKARVPAEHKFMEGVEWAIDELVEAQRSAKETAKNDASFKRRCAKYGTAAARFDVTREFGKETIWVEFGKGGEVAAKAQLLKQHPSLENWTVIA